MILGESPTLSVLQFPLCKIGVVAVPISQLASQWESLHLSSQQMEITEETFDLILLLSPSLPGPLNSLRGPWRSIDSSS